MISFRPKTVIAIERLAIECSRDGQRTHVLGHGEFLAIAGASGVGKSTLLRGVAGLALPGKWRGRLPASVDAARRPAALVLRIRG